LAGIHPGQNRTPVNRNAKKRVDRDARNQVRFDLTDRAISDIDPVIISGRGDQPEE